MRNRLSASADRERFAATDDGCRTSWFAVSQFDGSGSPSPPLEEQRRIAEILDTVDGAIQLYEAELVKLGELRAGLSADLLVGPCSDGGSMISGPEWELVEGPLLEHLGRLGWETLVWSQRQVADRVESVVGS